MRKLFNNKLFGTLTGATAFLAAPAAGIAMTNSRTADLGVHAGIHSYARDGTVIQVRDQGRPEHTWSVTRMERGKLITEHVAIYGRFSGAVQVPTSDTAATYWRQQYGNAAD